MISIIVCVRNEILTIEKILYKLDNLNLINSIKKQIIIVDNVSTDGTRDFLRKLNKKKYKIIFQKKNLGKGHSIKTALKYCNGKYIIPQDADLEYDPKFINKILIYTIKNKLDFVIGSRKKKNKKFHKYAINEYGANFLTFVFNRLFNSNFNDVASCYKMMNAKFLKKINLKCNGFDLDYEIASHFLKNKLSYGETFIKYNSRSYKEGRNLNIFFDGFKALFVLLRVKFYEKKL